MMRRAVHQTQQHARNAPSERDHVCTAENDARILVPGMAGTVRFREVLASSRN